MYFTLKTSVTCENACTVDMSLLLAPEIILPKIFYLIWLLFFKGSQNMIPVILLAFFSSLNEGDLSPNSSWNSFLILVMDQSLSKGGQGALGMVFVGQEESFASQKGANTGCTECQPSPWVTESGLGAQLDPRQDSFLYLTVVKLPGGEREWCQLSAFCNGSSSFPMYLEEPTREPRLI